jgi:hypothetical protein
LDQAAHGYVQEILILITTQCKVKIHPFGVLKPVHDGTYHGNFPELTQ